MRLCIVAATLASLLLSSGAAAAATLEVDVRFDVAPSLAGPVSLHAQEGLLDLGPVLAAGGPLRLAWDGATGYRVERTVDYLQPAGVPVYGRETARDNESLDLGAGRVVDVACAPGCKATLLPEGGALHLAGDAGGELGASEALVFSTGPQAPLADHFVALVPAGWLASEGALPEGRGRAEGDLLLFLDGVNVTLETTDGLRTLTTGVASRPARALAGAEVATRVEASFVVLHLRGARLEETAPGARLYAPALDAQLDGRLDAAQATGWARAWGETTTLDHEPLAIEGALVGTWDAQGARLSGEPTFVLAGARVREPPVDAPAASAALAAGIVALVLAALALYTRIGPKDVLENESRRRVYEHVRANPGHGLRRLARELDMPQAVLRYHVRILEQQSLTRSRLVGGIRAVFPADVRPDDVRVEARSPARVHIERALVGGLRTQNELVARTGISQRLVSYHLTQLAREGLVRVEEGRPKRYAALQPER